ncbi:AMP-binding protein [Phenylobacterium sp.]|uniref:AMP-binding protein n=1 Tax=Phenylobacterium sp. TaxID=1871053 RepID=UPI00356916C2
MQTLLSYVHGASEAPLIGATIGAYFDQVAGELPAREALVVRHQNIRWSYADLKRRVDDLACSFIRAGLKPGERIGIWSQNCAEWVLTQFATAKAGLILVNINPAYRCSELEYALNKVGCVALILAPRFKSSDYLAMLAELAPELWAASPGQLKAAALPELRLVVRLGRAGTPGMLNFDELLTPASEAELAALAELGATLQFDDPINIQFTSGTTGSPKGATLTHQNILNNGFFVGEAMGLTEQDRVCIPVPLYHCFGMVIGNLATVTHGGTMIFPGEAFEATCVLETIEDEMCTALHGVPTMFISLLENPKFASFDLRSLRTGMMAGAPCPIEVMKRVVDEMHMAEVTIGYGMTETSPISFQSGQADPLERQVSTVGRIQPHLEVKIVDENGHILPRGRKGELLTRGYSVMLGYWGDKARTREAIDAAGWMHTGDLATLDEAGYCKIVGRAKDMVIRGGENIFPREIEEFLYQHPKIQDVQVVGVPDAKYGEEVGAFVILRPGETAEAEEIRDFCRGQIAHFKIPRYVRFIEAFPMTVSGKVLKYELRERIARELDVRAVETA